MEGELRLEIRGVMGGLYRISEWIMRFTVTNLLWLLCSAPFMFFLLIKLLMSINGYPNESLQMSWAMGISAPFTLFPATAALFVVARKWVMGETEVKLLSTFFKGYKENYKQAMIGGIFYTLLFFVMYVDYNIYMTQFQSMQVIGWVMLGMLIILLISSFNFFSMLAHYHMKTFTILKNSILLTLFRPVRVVLSAVVSCGIVFIGLSYPRILPLVIFFFGSVIAYYAFFNFYATYQKMQAKQEAMQAQQEESEQTDQINLLDGQVSENNQKM